MADRTGELSSGLLRRGPSFLIVDTVEHLIPDLCAELSLLCRMTPSLRLLATSREPLRVDGEALYRLASLSLERVSVDGGEELSEAATLPVDRIRATVGEQGVSREDAPYTALFTECAMVSTE